MKLIALRNFRNTQDFEIAGAVHPKQISKGQVFSIGADLEFGNLKRDDQNLVHSLNVARCVGDAGDKRLVDRVNQEVVDEKKAEARAEATSMAAGSDRHLAKRLDEIEAERKAAAAAKK